MKVIAKAGSDSIASVYIAETEKGRIEFVESLQPPIPREKKWVLIVSSLYGCPVGCAFCDAGGFYHGRVSTADLLAQIDFLVQKRFPGGNVPVEKFKIQFARMGEPAFNPHVLTALETLPSIYDAPGLMPSLSTVAPYGTEAFFQRLLDIKTRQYRGRFQLQFSIHTTDEKRRDELVPIRKWSFREMGRYGRRFAEGNQRKVTLNFALGEGAVVDEGVLLSHFSPELFLIKITPVNPTVQAVKNNIISYIKDENGCYEVVQRLKAAGYDVVLSIGELEENAIGSNCGQYIARFESAGARLSNSYTYAVNALSEVKTAPDKK